MSDAERFYGRAGLNVETYDAMHELHTRSGEVSALDGDIKFFRRRAAQSGGPVLELACGTGRVLWPLADSGFEMVGVDLSEAMLAVARAKAESHTVDVRKRVRLEHASMTDFDLGRAFPLVFITFRSFQSLLTPEEERDALACIHRHLEPGGRLIINIFDPRLDYCVPGAPSPAAKPDGIRHPATGNEVTIQIVSRSTDPLRQIIEERWCFREHGAAGEVIREEEETLRLRWIYRYEMRYLFELTGFEVEAEYSDFHENPPAYGKEQIWIVRKE